MNEWGLFLVGLGLIMGAFGRLATYGGMIILAMYYLAHPPIIGNTYAFPAEGSYLFVDKNMVEFIALGVLSIFPTSKIIGLDRFLNFIKK